MVEHLSVNSLLSANREIQVRFLWQHYLHYPYQAELGRHGFVDGLGNHYNLLDYPHRPTVIDMTEDGCGCFFLVFKNGKPSHWVGDSGVEKDMEEMIEFITDELSGEFKIIQF